MLNRNDNFDLESIISSNPLHIAACTGDIHSIEQLIRQGIDVNTSDYLGRTSLHFAIEYNQIEAIDKLIELGANINATETNYGDTPLHHAIRAASSLHSITALLKHSPDIHRQNASQDTPLHLAMYSSNQPIIEELLKHNADLYLEHLKDINKPMHNGKTALDVAIRGHRVDLIHRLVRMGADINDTQCGDKCFKDTPLHHAIRLKNNLPIVVAILQHRPNINALNGLKQTPLETAVHYARQKKPENVDALAIVELLLKANADIYAKLYHDHDITILHNTAYLHRTCTSARKVFELMINATLLDLGEKMLNLLNKDERGIKHYSDFRDLMKRKGRKIIFNTLAALHTNMQNIRASLTTDKTSLYRTAYLTGMGLFSKSNLRVDQNKHRPMRQVQYTQTL